MNSTEMNITNITGIDEVIIDQQIEEISYLTTDFFYNLLPCYLFFIAGIYRMCTIKKEALLAEEEKNDEKLNEEINEKTPSLLIKTKLSQANALIYLISIILAFIVPKEIFSSSQYPLESLLYVFGVISWLISGKLTEMEFERGLNQELYAQRFFWSFSGGLTMVRLFQKSEHYLVNICFNVCRFVFNMILTIYALFKPYDREMIMGVVDEDMPTWARLFFDKLENNKIFGKFFGFIIRNNKEIELENVKIKSPTDIKEDLDKFIELNKENRKSNVVSNVNQEAFLLKNIPTRRTVAVSKNVIKKLINNNEQKVFYQIIVQINDNRYITEKKYSEFLALEKELNENYNIIDFPNLFEKLPVLEKVEVDEMKDEQHFTSRRIILLEKYIQNLLRSPAFIHPKLLTFLEIGEDDRSPFLSYYNYISKGVNQNKRKLSRTLNDLKSGGIRKISFKSDTPTTPYESEFTAKKKDFLFEAACVDWQKALFGDRYEFVIQIKLPIKNETWKINRTFAGIRDFHTDLENKTGNSIAFFSKYLQKTQGNSNDRGFLNQRKEGLDKYFKALVSNKNYFCDVFYDFIEFDPIQERHIFGNSRKNSMDVSEISENMDGREFYITFDENKEGLPDFPKKYTFKNISDDKLICGINFNFVLIRVVGVKSYNNEALENKVTYYLNFEEYYEQDNQLRVKTLIKIGKQYPDFSKLHQNIWKVYRDLNVPIPILPAQKLIVGAVTKFDPNERKTTWEGFFFNLLKLPRIEENENFQTFFNIDRIEKELENRRSNEKKVFDWT